MKICGGSRDVLFQPFLTLEPVGEFPIYFNGCATPQVVRWWLLIAEPLVQFRVTSCEICGGLSRSGGGSSKLFKILPVNNYIITSYPSITYP
jgi:hypothetical protein